MQRQAANSLNKSLIKQDDAFGLVWVIPRARKPDDVLTDSDPPSRTRRRHQPEQIASKTQSWSI
jgi:hypothetical protein